MNNVISADTRPNIRETIGSTAMMEQLALSAAELSCEAQRISSTSRNQNPQLVDVDLTATRLKRAFNLVLMCAEYLGIQEDDYTQMVNLFHWHNRLQQAGIEDVPEEKETDIPVWHRFKSAEWMGDGDE